MLRRDFLRNLGFIPLAVHIPSVAFATSPADYRRLLLLIELQGGNDGLNTVVPYADAAYYALRPRLAIQRDAVLQLDQKVGLHPGLQPLVSLWEGGEMAVVQGVGYPQPNLSHFRSIEIWDTASSSIEYLNDGWLARVFAARGVPKSFSADGVVVGSRELGPLAGARAIALASPEQFARQARLAENDLNKTKNTALAHIIKVEGDIVRAASGLAGSRRFQTDFPKHAFGNSLKAAAQVVAGPAGVAVVRVTHSGFDTHSGQPGVHQRLLQEFSEGVAAFKRAMLELGRWDDTLMMTYSEFGRRPQQNASLGTDHGTANVHFMFGGRVKGGLYGQAPDLQRLEGANLVHAVDFRSLYASVVERWWGADSRAVLNGRFATLDLLRA